ncbi:hypothetical protein [Zymomonas mobilis]|uniref:hypothetical protein n=1 Tax=Zymomonas mobilis TaxID=542 RepID=UPI0039E92349
MAIDGNFQTPNGSSIGANFTNDNNEKKAGLNYSHLFSNEIILGIQLKKDFKKSNRNKVETNVKIPF